MVNGYLNTRCGCRFIGVCWHNIVFRLSCKAAFSLPPLIEVPAILDPLCSNPRDYNHGGLPPLVPAIGKSVIPLGNNAVTEPPSFRGRDLFSDLGVYPLESPKADPARAKRKKKK